MLKCIIIYFRAFSQQLWRHKSSMIPGKELSVKVGSDNAWTGQPNCQSPGLLCSPISYLKASNPGNCPPSQKNIWIYSRFFTAEQGAVPKWVAGLGVFHDIPNLVCMFFSTKKCSNVRLRVHSWIFWISILVNWVPWGAWVDDMVQILHAFCMQFWTCQIRKCWLPFWVTGWSVWH